ncbi:MAG TPA: tetratricopeptide repeat protein [Methyloversatilis sp.]
MNVDTRTSSVLQSARSCPYCMSTDTADSSWKTSGEKAGRFWLKPVRCRTCHKRYVRVRRAPLAVVAGMLVIGLTVTIAVVFHNIETRTPDEHLKLMAELDPREAERVRAETGDPEAQYDYGMLLSQGGTGERADLVEAVKWLEKSAVQGNARAQYELALALKLGRGTLQDYSAAAQWFAKAANQGHVSAQYHMGRLYRIGEGVTQDLVRAYAWFNRAAAQGHGAARGARDEIASSLKPEQLSQAQELSRAAIIADAPAAKEADDIPRTDAVRPQPVDFPGKR